MPGGRPGSAPGSSGCLDKASGQQGRLAEQDQVVGSREVFEEQTQLAQALGLHEMGIVDDRDDQFGGAMEAEGFLNQEPFALMVASLELNLEGLAKDAEGAVVSMQGAVDHGSDHAFGVLLQESLLEDRLARSGFTQDQAPCWAWTRRMSRTCC